jgi:hypothetical protein
LETVPLTCRTLRGGSGFCVRKTDTENTAVVSAKAAAAMGSDPPDHESILETVKLLQVRSIQQDSKLDLLQKDNTVMKRQIVELNTRMGKCEASTDNLRHNVTSSSMRLRSTSLSWTR